MRGVVHLVGAGPGDRGLITVRGLELLRRADVVVYDSLANEALLEEARPGAQRIDVGKRGGDHKMEQEDIDRLLVRKAGEGLMVVRLKGGDPFLFGRGAEEAEALRKEGMEVHVVPGVSSAIAAPETAGIPVTHRDISSVVTIVTGNEGRAKGAEAVDWEHLARSRGTIVMLMGMANLGRNMARLMASGLDPGTPVAVVHRGASAGQRTVLGTIGDIEGVCQRERVSSPAVNVIGGVAAMRAVLGDLQ
jgi:uroporphyrin-III C-methyltransferase